VQGGSVLSGPGRLLIVNVVLVVIRTVGVCWIFDGLLGSFSWNLTSHCRVDPISGASALARSIRRPAMHNIFYLIGLAVVVLVIINLAL